MEYKAYYHRYGGTGFEEFDSLEEATEFIHQGQDEGECFGDCVVNSDGVIVYDFDSESTVIGRDTPKSRVGEMFKE